MIGVVYKKKLIKLIYCVVFVLFLLYVYIFLDLIGILLYKFVKIIMNGFFLMNIGYILKVE